MPCGSIVVSKQWGVIGERNFLYLNMREELILTLSMVHMELHQF